jgi:hypothetical protein
MPLFMDEHNDVEGLTAEAVAEAHQKDLNQSHGETYMRPNPGRASDPA